MVAWQPRLSGRLRRIRRRRHEAGGSVPRAPPAPSAVLSVVSTGGGGDAGSWDRSPADRNVQQGIQQVSQEFHARSRGEKHLGGKGPREPREGGPMEAWNQPDEEALEGLLGSARVLARGWGRPRRRGRGRPDRAGRDGPDGAVLVRDRGHRAELRQEGREPRRTRGSSEPRR